MSHQIVIKIGTVGHLNNDDKLLIVLKIEGNVLYCHRFRSDNKFIKIDIKHFKPLIY
jgi:hypothetical protein